MSRWFRFYDEVVEDPKAQRLPPALFKFWVNCLCIASKNGGDLPPLAHLSFTLRMSESQIATSRGALAAAELLDEEDGIFTPHNWNGRQFKSDDSSGRVKRYRERKKGVNNAVTGNDDVTLHVTPPETEQRQNRPEQKQTPPKGDDVDLLGEKPGKPVAIQIPEWVPVIPWQAFVAMRKRIKKPITDDVLKRLLPKLTKLKGAGHDIGAVLDNSVLNQWQDVYAPKPEGNRANGRQPAISSFGAAMSRVVAERAGSGSADQDGEGIVVDAEGEDAATDRGGNSQLRLAHHQG